VDCRIVVAQYSNHQAHRPTPSVLQKNSLFDDDDDDDDELFLKK